MDPITREWSPAEIEKEVLRAETRIRPHIRHTLLDPSPFLSETCGAPVWLKLENLQVTGSFKARGAFNKILWLQEQKSSARVVTASSGNHGMAVACGLSQLGGDGVVFLPESVAQTKLNSLKRYGVECVLRGRESGEAETIARLFAEENGSVYISPYNDPQVIAGQGTLGLELLQDLPDMDAVFISVGGGGLISGVGACLKKALPKVKLVGCLPENSPVMYKCFRAGHIVDWPCQPTLSDGTAGSVERGSITFELCRDLIDDWILTSEEEIADAMKLLLSQQRIVVEGSAAVAVAAFLKASRRYRGLKTVLVLCGGNVDFETIRRIVCREKAD